MSLIKKLRAMLRGFLPKPDEQYYFAAWSAYGVPLIPRRQISHDEAKTLPAYCEVTFYANGLVKCFKKWFCNNSADGIKIHLLFEHRYEYYPNGQLRRWEWQEGKVSGEKMFECKN